MTFLSHSSRAARVLKPALLVMMLAAAAGSAAVADEEGVQAAGKSAEWESTGEAQAEQPFVNPSNLFPRAEELGSSQLLERRDAYLKRRGFRLGTENNPGGAWIGWGEAPVMAAAGDLDFGKSRIAAFERAFTMAKEDFVKFTTRKIRTETLREFLHDSSDPSLSAPDAQADFDVMWEKIKALSDAELDEKLREKGVDPDEIENASPEKKRQLARDYIERRVVTESVGRLAGLRPMVTFEAKDARNQFSVGVLAVYSDNFRRFARSIAEGRLAGDAALRLDPGPPVDEQIPREGRDLVDEFGVRVLVDEKGDRVMVAFGQWSPAVTAAMPRNQQEAAIKAAREQAEAQAHAALADFVNSTLIFNSNERWSEVGSQVENLYRNGLREQEDFRKVIDFVKTVSKQHGRATLSGVLTVRDWQANHPETGHLLVGKVLMWSPTSAGEAHRIRMGHKPQEQPGAAPRAVQPATRQSRDFEREDVF
ncbi:MAG: hypothetical protein Kow0059_15620 [Candidatus Sumerlaeia bacterium]